MIIALLAIVALAQSNGWSVWPPHPSVGDTVWLERVVPVPAGWRVRSGPLPAGENYEPLSDPLVLRHDAGWMVRYVVVIWTPGSVSVTAPPIWRLGPGGEADSADGGSLAVAVRSVIPDTVTAPQPKPPLAPLWPDVHRPLVPGLAVLVAAVVLAGGIAWRRRGPRPVPDPSPPTVADAVVDDRWIAAGESRAVAARAAAILRGALARAAPTAHSALSTFEALAAARELPQPEQQELAAVLTALDQVGFAAVHGAEVRVLAQRAYALARKLAP